MFVMTAVIPQTRDTFSSTGNGGVSGAQADYKRVGDFDLRRRPGMSRYYAVGLLLGLFN
jgi:hypothetical protein